MEKEKLFADFKEWYEDEMRANNDRLLRGSKTVLTFWLEKAYHAGADDLRQVYKDAEHEHAQSDKEYLELFNPPTPPTL